MTGMVCNSCNGPVEWKGPMINLTHTECLNCGAVNNQVPDVEDDLDDNECTQCGCWMDPEEGDLCDTCSDENDEEYQSYV